jgi:hypothetical protein
MADKLTIDKETPGNAVRYIAPDGTTFLAPPTADFLTVYAYGKMIASKKFGDQKAAIGVALAQGGLFDFQRSGGVFYPSYTDASNYAVGVLMNGAGYSWAETEAVAGYYATWNSSQGWTHRQTIWWQNGFSAAEKGHLPAPPYPISSETHHLG